MGATTVREWLGQVYSKRGPAPYLFAGFIIVLGLVIAAAAVSAIANRGFSQAASPSTCTVAVQRAASVPVDQANDVEVEATLTACKTYAEWSQAVRADPTIFGVTTISEADLTVYVTVACANASEAAVCLDAARNGAL